MAHLQYILAGTLFLSAANAFAFEVIQEVAAQAGGYDIPIKVCIPQKGQKEKMPVVFFVHGGGWNGGDEKEVPPVGIPADCSVLCDELGVIYVGLAYRCKGNKATFHMALQDLEASIKWFEGRAETFNADMSRIGFSGGSAGTTLSAVLAQRYPNAKVYVGSEGMYNVLDLDPELSHFPDEKSRADFGLITREQKLEASPFHQVRKNPATALLLHGKDDWLCHYTQSVKYAEQLRKSGGKCQVVLYDGINHTSRAISYPEVFENSMMEIARLYADGYGLKDVDFNGLAAKLKTMAAPFYPYEKIPLEKLPGTWKSERFGTITFRKDGTGSFSAPTSKKQKALTYKPMGPHIAVTVEGETGNRHFYLRKNDRAIYELITENTSFKSRRNDYKRHR